MMKTRAFKGRAGMPQEYMTRQYETRVVPDLTGYDGTYKGVMEDMHKNKADLKKEFKPHLGQY